jgi:hypothetical protein
VSNVHQNAKLVMPTVVLTVTSKEFNLHQNVHAKMDTLSKQENATLVTKNAKHVLDVLNVVLNVLKTELIHQPVAAHQEHSIPVMQDVHLVPHNVKNVLTLPTIAQNVLKVTLIHQNVLFLHHQLNQLR